MSRFAKLFVLFVALIGLGTWGGNASAAIITSTAAGGTWTAAGTWVGGVAPATGDTVIIATTGAGVVNIAANLTQTAAGSVTVNSGASLTASAGTTTFGALTINSTGTFSTSRVLNVLGATNITGTINFITTARADVFTGDVTLNGGAVWNEAIAITPTFSGNFTNNATTFTASTGTHTFNGATKILSGATTTSIPRATFTGNYTNSGTLTSATLLTVTGAAIRLTNNGTITATTALSGTGGVTQGATGVLNIGGTSTITTLDATAAGNTVNYTGAAQTVKATTYHHLQLTSVAAAAKTAAAGLTVNGDFTVSGAANFTAGAFTHNFAGNWTVNTTAAAPLSVATTSIINFNTPAIPAPTSVGGTTAATLAFGDVNINNTSGVNFNDNASFSSGTTPTLTVAAGATLTPAAAVIVSGTGTLTGSGTVQVTRTAATANFASQYTITTKTLTNLTVEYIGAAAQTVSVLTYGSATGGGLKVNNASGVSLTASTTVAGTLTLESGVVNAGAFTLIGSGDCTTKVARTGGHVAGLLQLAFPVGAPNCTFHVGDATTYRPINANFTSVTVAGSLAGGVSQAAGEHPNIATSGLDATQDVNRYWTLTNPVGGTIAYTTYTATFNFINPTDFDAGATPTTFEIERWDGAAWNITTLSSATATSTAASGLPSVAAGSSNSFAVGGKNPPVVVSINRADADPTNAASVSWTVIFSRSVTGVSSGNFTLVPTGLGGTPAITGVSGSGTTWTVTASTGTGDGTLGLNMVNTTGVSPAITGLPFTTGQAYTLDRTAPTVSSIARVDPTPTALANVSWTVTFSESVTGVDAADFALVQAGGVSGALITAVTGGGASWTVTVSTGIGQGTLGLNLIDNDSIMDGASNPLGGTGAGNGNATGEVYTVTRPSVYYHDTTTGVNIGFDGPTNVTSGANQTIPPIITASLITGNTCAGNARSNNHPAGLYTHSRWYLTTDYAVATNIGANPTGSASLSGQAATDTVIVSLYDYDPVLGGKTLIGSSAAITLTGGGTVTAYPYTISSPLYAVPAGHRLMLEYNFNQPNGGNNARVFCSAASAYITVTETTAPATVSSINRADPNPTNAATVSWTVTFNTGVTGVSSSNFLLVPSGLGGAPAITSVAGSGTTWTVTASTGTGNGTLGLDMVNVAGISPAVITAMPFTGQVYSIDRVAPVVSSITRIDSTPTALASVSWTVNFSEIVTGVDVADFALVWAGGAGGGSITSVTQDIGTTWIVTASTGVSNGTLGLNLVDDDTIIDAAGNPLGGAGAANGDSVGEVYALNFTAPSFVFTDSTCAHNIAFGAPGQTCALVTWSPQVAGQDSPGVYITAVNAAGIPTRLNAALRTRNMQFGLACHDPVADAGIPAVFAGLVLPLCQPSGGTPVAWSAAVTVTFNGGIPSSAVSYVFSYADVGSVELWMRNSATPAQVGFSGPFVVKPGGFALSGIMRTSDSFANPAAANATGVMFVRAGEAFTAAVTATTIDGVTATPNYGQEAVPESVKLTPALVTGLGLTNNPAIGGTFGAFVGGVATGAFTWREVGIIKLTPSVGDGDYLGAGDVTGTASGNVGRFYAAKFALIPDTIANRTGLGGVCAAPVGCGTFTYMGEQMSALFTLTAQAVDGTTTQNYATANNFAKLDPTAAGNPLALAAVDTGSPRTVATLDTTTYGVASGNFVSGVASITAPFAVTRGASVFGPFDALDVGVKPADSDGATLAMLNLAVNAGGSPDTHGKIGTTEARYGRMKLSNAHGSELLPLTINVAAQFWNGTTYATNALDNNSTFAATDVILNNYTKNLASGETSVVTPPASVVFAGGVASYQLARPSVGDGKYDGSVSMTVNALSAYLPSNTARATFGVYKGNNEFIYLREAY